MSEEAAFDNFATDHSNDIGVDAIFTPAAGDPIPLKVYFGSVLAMQPTSYETRSWQDEISIEFVLNDIGRDPNRGETFTYNSVVYTVQGVSAKNGRFCTVAVT